MNILDNWGSLFLKTTIALAVAWLFYYKSSIDADRIRAACSVIASVSVTLLGFLITAVAIITALAQETLISNMKKTGHYQTMIRGIFSTCLLLLITLITSIVTLTLADEQVLKGGTVVTFSVSLSIMYTLTSGYRFSNVVSSI